MGETWEVRLSGSGGQGLILAGVILAEAAGVYGGRQAVQTQSYGPEARGGASRSDVIISDDPIEYPKAEKLHVLLCLNQESLDLYFKYLRPEGIAIVDSGMAPNLPDDDRLVGVPITQATVDRLGKSVVANIVALSIIQGITGIVSFDHLREAVLKRVPEAFGELNAKALQLGQELAAQTGRRWPWKGP